MKKETIQKIKEKNNVVDVLSEYIDVKQQGKTHTAVCPFHNDNDPSLKISKGKGLWHCLGCGEGGDVINFVMEIENVPFPEAARILARRAGISVETEGRQDSDKEILYGLLPKVANYFHDNLINKDIGKDAREYLKGRGYGKEMIDEFNIGYAKDSWRDITRRLAKNYEKEFAKKTGLVKENEKGDVYDTFRDRIIFPITSSTGRVIAFGGRVIKDENDRPKYLNSPDTPLFSKQNTLYALDKARKHANGRIVVVEGYTDVISLYQAGHKNTIATLGTALTNSHARTIKRYTDGVTIAYDEDQAGSKATMKGLRKIRNQGLAVDVVELERGEDPADLVRKNDSATTDKKIKNATPFYEFFVNHIKGSYNLSNIAEKDKALKRSRSFIADIDSLSLQQKLVDSFSTIFGVPKDKLFDTVENLGHIKPSEIEQSEKQNNVMQTNDWVLFFLLKGTLSLEMVSRDMVKTLTGTYRGIVKEMKIEGSTDTEDIIAKLTSKQKSTLAKIATEVEENDMGKSRLSKLFNETMKKLWVRGKGERIVRIADKLQQGINGTGIEESMPELVDSIPSEKELEAAPV